ncbi:phosphocholine cytidylyltransferase family protein [Shimia sp. FJ5]|uniref:phosphocholine cytidylyltransferase family protein n=1 Tax=Shimia sp. FJ5 TaxID=3079054 RepID=UPI00260B4C6A|nr:phosphocholine cytidylyltransferase family protein [Shimia sp. FJ5]MDV4146179.1 phosphocholine cytidylyltransferase family protein [Shimia sp. FJ5]
MSEVSALIVAAGRGIRMGSRGEMTPKGLLEIDGTALVARSVALLKKSGVKRVRIVTGHLAEQYEAAFGDMEGVDLVHNPAFATTGSGLSMMTGLAEMAGPVLLLESDLVYEAAALGSLHQGESCILVSGESNAGDEVYIWTREGANGGPVFDMMSKNIAAVEAQHFGELVGISRFTAEDTERLKAAAETVLEQDPKADYEETVIHMARTQDIACRKIEDLAWSEIDSEIMYAHALKEVWPKIVARDGAR